MINVVFYYQITKNQKILYPNKQKSCVGIIQETDFVENTTFLVVFSAKYNYNIAHLIGFTD